MGLYFDDRILSEDPFPLQELPRHVESLNVSYQTLRRWAIAGLVVNGDRVKLGTCRQGRKILTSVEAFERFTEATTK